MNAAFRDSNNAATSSTFMHASGMGGGGFQKITLMRGGGPCEKKSAIGGGGHRIFKLHSSKSHQPPLPHKN